MPRPPRTKFVKRPTPFAAQTSSIALMSAAHALRMAGAMAQRRAWIKKRKTKKFKVSLTHLRKKHRGTAPRGSDIPDVVQLTPAQIHHILGYAGIFGEDDMYMSGRGRYKRVGSSYRRLLRATRLAEYRRRRDIQYPYGQPTIYQDRAAEAMDHDHVREAAVNFGIPNPPYMQRKRKPPTRMFGDMGRQRNDDVPISEGAQIMPFVPPFEQEEF